MPLNLTTLRSQLADFRARSAAIDRTIDAGEDGINAAIQLLNDRKEAVRWSAIRILSDIGDNRAVEPLIQLLERNKSSTDAANALRNITGQNFGEDGAAWRTWASGQEGIGVSSERKELPDDVLVELATRDLDAEVTQRKGRHVVTVSLPEGRKQTVYVVFTAKDTQGDPIVWLYTPCCEATPEKHEWALKQNLRLRHGAIGIARIGNADCFVMSNTHLRATVDAEDLAKSLLALASRGDVVEKLLSGGDER